MKWYEELIQGQPNLNEIQAVDVPGVQGVQDVEEPPAQALESLPMEQAAGVAEMLHKALRPMLGQKELEMVNHLDDQVVLHQAFAPNVVQDNELALVDFMLLEDEGLVISQHAVRPNVELNSELALVNLPQEVEGQMISQAALAPNVELEELATPVVPEDEDLEMLNQALVPKLEQVNKPATAVDLEAKGREMLHQALIPKLEQVNEPATPMDQEGEGQDILHQALVPNMEENEPASAVAAEVEVQEMLHQALVPNVVQENESALVNLNLEANLNSRKRRGRPPKHLAPGPQNLLNQLSLQHSRRRIKDFILPDGWTTEVRVRKNGRSAGNKDKYYIEEKTKHVCRSQSEMKAYIESKEKVWRLWRPKQEIKAV